MANKLITLIVLFVLTIAFGCQTQSADRAVDSKPDDRVVAFSRLTGDYWQIWIMRPDGTSARQITMSLADKRYPVWSKDGQKLFFRTNNNQAFSVDIATGQENRILNSLGWICGLALSPDGDEMLLVRLQIGLKDRGDLWVTTIDGSKSRILFRERGLQYDPAWSPDGKEIVYTSGFGGQTFELYCIDTSSKNKRRLTENKALELLPVFSPDGSTIAYVSDITGDYEIWLMEVDGNNNKQLTDYEGIDTRPVWSPDGGRVMFVSNRSGELHIWIMNSDGSSPQQLTTGTPSMDPCWKKE